MKKVVVAVVVLLLLGAGGYYLYAKSASKMAPAASTEQNSGGVFGSIKDALSKSLSLQCAFTADDGVPTTAYIKAGAVRVDTNGKTVEQQGSFIMKDKKIYFWQTATKQGTMMSVPEVSVTPTSGSTVKPTAASSEGDNMMAALEKFKNDCKPAVVADSLFTPPADVKFTDFSQMMKQVPSGMPSGYPTGMSQQDVQKMMQQYQPTGTTGY